MAQRDPIWPDELLDDPHRWADKSVRVKEMFDLIAQRYDLANTIISFGLAQYARYRFVQHIRSRLTEARGILDVCAGPGTMAVVLARTYPRAEVTAVDFSLNMLKAARRGIPSAAAALTCADALALPFRDNTFDLITCAYGLRNLQDLDRGLSEASRVLKPSGLFAALDFQMPRHGAFRWVFNLYFTHVLPVLGAIVAGRGRPNPYKYLPCSVTSWYDQDGLVRSFDRAGLKDIFASRIGPGVVVIISGVK